MIDVTEIQKSISMKRKLIRINKIYTLARYHNPTTATFLLCMKYLTLAFLLVLSITAKSQENESYYVFDAAWNPTKIDKAIFLLHTHKISDSCWQFDFYNFKGPLIKTERYLDQKGTTITGDSYHYNNKGVLDSTGTFHNGKRNGDFYRLTDLFKPKWKYVWREDSLISVTDLENLKKDSSISYKDEKESDYPGGTTGWSNYLMKNLKYPDRAISYEISGQVTVRFVVDREGNVGDCYIAESVEYSLDEEALRIIKKSGKWTPAFQNDHYVKSYKSQPLKFKLNDK